MKLMKATTSSTIRFFFIVFLKILCVGPFGAEHGKILDRKLCLCSDVGKLFFLFATTA